MKYFFGLIVSLMLFACGTDHVDYRTRGHTETDTDKLNKTILELKGLQAQISTLILSDYATCTSTPSDGGSTNDALIRKICQIAQASTIESKNQLKGELQAYINTLETELNSVQDRLATVEANTANTSQILTDLYGTGNSCATATAGSICARVTALESSVSTLQSQMTSANSAISVLQGQVAAINATINAAVAGMMTEVTIGNENLAAGPLYESVLRKQDRTRINAYIEDIAANQSLGNNPFSASNGSPTVTVTLTAHGLSVGNVVKFDGLQSGRGFLSGQVNDSYIVDTVPNANTFTITMTSNATSGGTFGGSVGYFYKINGRGLGQAWAQADGEVYATSTFSNKPYKFLITGAATVFGAAPTGASLPVGWAGLTPGFGFICYSKTDRSATAATIKAGGANIVCK